VVLHAVFFVAELVDLPVAIARDVGEDPLPLGFFAEAVDGTDGEKLIDGPMVGEALKDREVHVVDVGEHLWEVGEVVGQFALGRGDVVDPATDGPEQTLGRGPHRERQVPEVEEAHGLFARLDGVVVDLDEIEPGLRESVPCIDEFENGLWALALFFHERFAPDQVGLGGEIGLAQNVDDQERAVRDHRAAAFGDDARMLEPGGVTDRLDPVDDIACVLSD